MSTTTTIQLFANYVGLVYTFQDLQPDHQKKVAVNKITTASATMGVPVCNSSTDFKNGNYITVGTNNEISYYIWQHQDTDGDFVRCSTTGYVPGAAPKIPGAYTAGGNKGLSVMPNGSLEMTTYTS